MAAKRSMELVADCTTWATRADHFYTRPASAPIASTSALRAILSTTVGPIFGLERAGKHYV